MSSKTILIADLLIDWSRKSARQKLIDHESKVPSSTNEQEANDSKYLLKKSKEETASEADKHLSSSEQEDSRRVDERESSHYFPEQKQQAPRENIHTHDTASGFDDNHDHAELQSNRENNLCQNGNPSLATYFSKLRDKLIKCDES